MKKNKSKLIILSRDAKMYEVTNGARVTHNRNVTNWNRINAFDLECEARL